MAGAWYGGWRATYAAPLLPALLLTGGMPFLPESPRWMLLQMWQRGVIKVSQPDGWNMVVRVSTCCNDTSIHHRHAAAQAASVTLSGAAHITDAMLKAGAHPPLEAPDIILLVLMLARHSFLVLAMCSQSAMSVQDIPLQWTVCKLFLLSGVARVGGPGAHH
jgi:hypothetical protein